MHYIVYGPYEMCLFPFYISVAKNIHYRNLLLYVWATLCDVMCVATAMKERHGSHQEGKTHTACGFTGTSL
jgi:hypothetical protein